MWKKSQEMEKNLKQDDPKVSPHEEISMGTLSCSKGLPTPDSEDSCPSDIQEVIPSQKKTANQCPPKADNKTCGGGLWATLFTLQRWLMILIFEVFLSGFDITSDILNGALFISGGMKM